MEMINFFNGLISRLYTAEDAIFELEGISEETSKTKIEKKNGREGRYK